MENSPKYVKQTLPENVQCLVAKHSENDYLFNI